MDTGPQAVRLTNVDIDNALDNNHFQVIFQPIFDLGDGTIMRVESFVRWTHPGLGVLPPGAFISFFESQGRMGELTRHVVTTALDDYIAWRGTDGPGLSINLAQSDVIEPDFAKWFALTLKERKFPARLITLECPALPSTTPVKDAAKHFTRLRKTGARLAIEVRGRANDLLRTIDPFPFDELKTGGSAILRFARTMRGGPGLTAISELLDLAKANDAGIIAVGVEDQPSLKALAGLGFTGAQGNYLATIRALDTVEPGLVGHVRNVLALEPVDSDQMDRMARGLSPARARSGEASGEPVATSASGESAGTAATKPKTAPRKSSSRKSLAEAKLTPEKLALLKKKAAEVAARKRAEKKAAEAADMETADTGAADSGTTGSSATEFEAETAAPEQTAADLNETHNTLREVAARKQAEENARRLQSRLSQAYELPHETELRLAAQSGKTSGKTGGKSAGRSVEADAIARPIVTLPEPYSPGAFAKPDPDPDPDPRAGLVLDAPRTRGTERSVDRTGAQQSEPTIAQGNFSEGERVSDSMTTPAQSRRSRDADSIAPDTVRDDDQPGAVAPPATNSVADETSSDEETADQSGPGDVSLSTAGGEESPREQEQSTQIGTGSGDRDSEWYPKLPHFRGSITGSLRLTGISATSSQEKATAKASETEKPELDEELLNQVVEPDTRTRIDSQPDLTAGTLPVEPVAVSAASDAAPPPQVDESVEPYSSADAEMFKSEDEVLDEAFEGATELDPTQAHADDTEGPIELDSTEREIAGRLRGLKRPKRKNWLMRRHRVVPTHFWPRAWKRKWRELRTDDDYGDDDIRAEPVVRTGRSDA
ncbi:EAL domain-containing protein [Aquisalinus flavus]|uniref:EAL domain-containing protein n=1 Tax=Aquisalinus flavus TaxID=1526572 RepID=A0A8J2V2D6_9PROT|nr:EAL domain-containing protein [Aquisalinus flavus]MBD0427514.1 EAL domain-containing protein [Aquisalinus flavus]GGD01570.1 hypothetical protein GCM10011342_08270 [Aquisalinus flavus]